MKCNKVWRMKCTPHLLRRPQAKLCFVTIRIPPSISEGIKVVKWFVHYYYVIYYFAVRLTILFASLKTAILTTCQDSGSGWI